MQHGHCGCEVVRNAVGVQSHCPRAKIEATASDGAENATEHFVTSFLVFGKCVSNKLIVIFNKMTLLAALLINTKMETVLMRGGLLAFSGDDSFSISRHRCREYGFAVRTVQRRNCGKRSA